MSEKGRGMTPCDPRWHPEYVREYFLSGFTIDSGEAGERLSAVHASRFDATVRQTGMNPAFEAPYEIEFKTSAREVVDYEVLGDNIVKRVLT